VAIISTLTEPKALILLILQGKSFSHGSHCNSCFSQVAYLQLRTVHLYLFLPAAVPVYLPLNLFFCLPDSSLILLRFSKTFSSSHEASQQCL